MRESDTYLAMLDEGRVEGHLEELKSGILRQGRIRFGISKEGTSTAINLLPDLEHLPRMRNRLVDPNLTDWQELLNTP